MLLNQSNRRTTAQAVEALHLERGAAAADIGFGGGLGLSLLLGAVGEGGRVYGIDLSQEMVDRATRRFGSEIAKGGLTLRHGTLMDLPIDDGSLDGAVTVNTIYFIAELDRAFRELARTLKPSGGLVVGVGDPAEMARAPFTAYGFRLRPVEEIVAVAEIAGLELRSHSRSRERDRGSHLLAFSRRSAR